MRISVELKFSLPMKPPDILRKISSTACIVFADSVSCIMAFSGKSSSLDALGVMYFAKTANVSIPLLDEPLTSFILDLKVSLCTSLPDRPKITSAETCTASETQLSSLLNVDKYSGDVTWVSSACTTKARIWRWGPLNRASRRCLVMAGSEVSPRTTAIRHKVPRAISRVL